MFGYISVNRPELKIREFESYHAYYCGLCRALKRRHGRSGQLTLSYDMTFLALLLSGLYEPEEVQRRFRCAVHPGVRQTSLCTRYTDYAADMNLLLSYFDLLDDWKDEKNVKSRALSKALAGHVARIREQYPRQFSAVRTYVDKLGACEAAGEPDLDLAAGLTGGMFGEIFVPEEDLWSPTMRRLGFFLGKFIYLMDAWEDIDEDRKMRHYNPWLLQEPEPDAAQAESVLNMMMSECALCFEALPVIRNAEILRNILYSGVWNKFAEKAAKQAAEGGKKEPD